MQDRPKEQSIEERALQAIDELLGRLDSADQQEEEELERRRARSAWLDTVATSLAVLFGVAHAA